MNLNEAKQNIGKEVVLLEHTKPYTHSNGKIFNKAVSKQLERIECLKIDFITRGNVVVNTLLIDPKHIALKQPTYKVGDQVVLDESTKPYTLTNSDGDTVKMKRYVDDSMVYKIIGICGDDDVHLADYGWIQSRHLKLAPQAEDQDFLKGDPVINGIHADIHNAMKGEHKEHLKLVINGKEIKNFNADEEVIISSQVNYHSEEMRVYRNEVAQILLASGVPLDKDFKNKIDLYVNAVTTK